MSPLPVIANTYRVALDWDLGAVRAANVLHFQQATGDETDLWDEIRSNLTDNMFKPIANLAAIESAAITKLDGSSATVTITDPSPQTGGTVSTELILNCGPVVSLHTALRGRSYRGRVFVPGIAESKYTNGVISNTELGNMVTGWNDFITAQVGALRPLVVASYLNETAEIVSSISINEVCGTQRRRQSRRRGI
jgi:hypothetical protein